MCEKFRTDLSIEFRIYTLTHDFISHSIIMIGSGSFFTDDLFIYFRLFLLTYIPLIRYIIYREYHASTKY